MRTRRFPLIQSNAALWIIFCLSIFICPIPVLGQNYGSGGEKVRVLKFAASFIGLPGVDIRDVQIAFQRIIHVTMIRETDPYDAELDIFMNWDKAVETLSSGGYHFVVLTGLDYASLNHSVPLRPIVILSRVDQPTESLLLITRKDTSLADLGPKPKLILEEGRIGEFSRIWLDTVLVQSGLNKSEKLFSEIDCALKPSRLLLPVFFGKADACVTTMSAFELMSELNPQIAKDLIVRQQSDGYIFWLLCATDLATPNDIALIDNDMAQWSPGSVKELDYAVQQALTLMQMKWLFSYKKEYLQATLDLFKHHLQLTQSKHGATRRD